MKVFIVEKNEIKEGELVGKYINNSEWSQSKFKYTYQIEIGKWENILDKKREEIYLTKKDAELASNAKLKLEEIAKAENIIKQYKEAVEVIKKAKKEGLKDLDFTIKLSNELKKSR